MTPYEALYGKKCRSPICWFKVGKWKFFRPEMVQETTNKIQLIREKMLIAQSRQKSYVNHKHKDLELNVGDHVFLRVSSKKGIMRFSKKGKLSPRYIRPFEILKRVGTMAYHLTLLLDLSSIHSIVHISVLQKYNPELSLVIQHETL